MFSQWNVGHQLSFDETSELIDLELKPIVEIASQAGPGIPFTDPYMCDGIYLDEKGRLFSSKAPASDSANIYTFLGNVNSELIFDRAYSLIIERDHELSLAIGSYFKGENFRPDDEFLIALPEFFWMRFGVEFESLSVDLDQSLRHSSQLYRFFADFLQSPYSAEFLGIATEANKQFSFESVYLRFKYGAIS